MSDNKKDGSDIAKIRRFSDEPTRENAIKYDPETDVYTLENGQYFVDVIGRRISITVVKESEG